MAYLFIFPKEIIFSAKQGLMLWYNSVLPSLFPFLITSGILIEIGAVSRLGKALEPFMRPVFNVPGCGGFAVIMGCLSGYPVGAKITADLREAGKLSREEAQRLISFCNSAGPLFILGAVGTAILGSAWAGYFIIITNYTALLIVGLIFRFYRKSAPKAASYTTSYSPAAAARHAEFISIGKMLGSSVANAIEVVVQVGGFIMLFSVLLSILQISGALGIASKLLLPLFIPLGLEPALAIPFASGTIEITNGIKMIGVSDAQYYHKILLAGMLVSFGGLSIFAQTVSFISRTDISAKIYFISKLFHAVIQLLLSVALYPFFAHKISDSVAVMKTISPTAGNFGNNFILSILCLLIAFLILLLISRKKT